VTETVVLAPDVDVGPDQRAVLRGAPARQIAQLGAFGGRLGTVAAVAASSGSDGGRSGRERIVEYHQKELRALLERVRDGFADLDAGAIDEFELDNLIHRYKRSANELWKYCELTRGSREQAADRIDSLQRRGESPDWWAAGATRRERDG
jgi:hypothetical protein